MKKITVKASEMELTSRYVSYSIARLLTVCEMLLNLRDMMRSTKISGCLLWEKLEELKDATYSQTSGQKVVRRKRRTYRKRKTRGA